jgi:hypothetical protein
VKGVFRYMKTDFVLIARNKLTFYMVIAPALLAFVFLAVVGRAGHGSMTFAGSADVPAQLVRNIEEFGKVERLADSDAVRARVERMDSAAGVVMADGKPVLIVEGNEAEGFAERAGYLVQRAAAGDIPHFEEKEIASKGNRALELTATSLLVLAIFIAGAVPGMNIVSERESKVLQATAVSPLGGQGYIAARALTAFILSLVNTVVAILIIGRVDVIGQMMVAAVSPVAVTLLIALLLGCSADNQISAIASIKLIMPVGLGLPITSTFVSDKLQFLYYWLPNYWQFKAVESAWAGRYDLLSCVLALVTGGIWLVLLRNWIGQKLGLR